MSTTTVVSTIRPGGKYTSVSSGSYYVYTTIPTASGASNSTAVGSGASLCFTCALTPTVVPSGYSDSGYGAIGATLTRAGTCTPRPGTGTTTFFTTHTVTGCPAISVCPASGYLFGGVTGAGATVVTTTDKNHNPITYTQIPTKTSPSSSAASAIDSTSLPTCPGSAGKIFSSQMGMQYKIDCGVYFTDETLSDGTSTQESLTGCIIACDAYNVLSFMIASPCLGVSYLTTQQKNNCLLKTGVASEPRAGVDSAQLLSPYQGPTGGNGTAGSGSGSGPGGGGSIGTVIGGSMTAKATTTAGSIGGGGGGYGGSGSSGSGAGTGAGTGAGEYQTPIPFATCMLTRFQGLAWAQELAPAQGQDLGQGLEPEQEPGPAQDQARTSTHHVRGSSRRLTSFDLQAQVQALG